MSKVKLLLILFIGLQSTTFAESFYGSIAYDWHNPQIVSIKTRQPSFWTAYNNAHAECKALGGGDCIVRAGIENGCLALVRSEDWRFLGIGVGLSKEKAIEDGAMRCYPAIVEYCSTVVTAFCARDQLVPFFGE